jgi:hypothetical protein
MYHMYHMYTAVLRSVCSYKFLEISLFGKKSNDAMIPWGTGNVVQGLDKVRVREVLDDRTEFGGYYRQRDDRVFLVAIVFVVFGTWVFGCGFPGVADFATASR